MGGVFIVLPTPVLGGLFFAFSLLPCPGCLDNLIDTPEYAAQLEELRSAMLTRMQDSTDPLLRAFQNRYDLDIVREEFAKVYPDHSG